MQNLWDLLVHNLPAAHAGVYATILVKSFILNTPLTYQLPWQIKYPYNDYINKSGTNLSKRLKILKFH